MLVSAPRAVKFLVHKYVFSPVVKGNRPMAITEYTGKVMYCFSYPSQDSSSSSLCTASDTLDVKIKGNRPCATAIKDKRNNLPANVSAYHRCRLQLMFISLKCFTLLPSLRPAFLLCSASTRRYASRRRTSSCRRPYPSNHFFLMSVSYSNIQTFPSQPTHHCRSHNGPSIPLDYRSYTAVVQT